MTKDSATARYLDSGRMLGHFQLLVRLGQGAFGEVWKARDTELDRIVAIKIPRREHLTEDESEKFLREARAAAQVRHPNIVSVHEVGREHGQIYIASDYIDGASLDEWMQAHSLTVRESVELCAKIAEALHHAHEAGVVHRDLKPQNILVRRDESAAGGQVAASNSPLVPNPSPLLTLTPYITDFGLAKRDAGEITMTVEGAILGTPAYMPPEQARGEAHHADRRSDVYSLGVILFRLLTGELPFRGQRQMLIVQILSEEPPALRKLDARLPRDVETICLKCLEKDPARRYQSAADLRRWLTGHPIQARPVSRTERALRWCHRNPAVASLSAAITIVLLIGITVSSFFAIKAAAHARDLTFETKRANQKAVESTNSAKLAQQVASTSILALYFRDASRIAVVSPDGQHILLAGDSNTFKQWKPAKNTFISFEGHHKNVTAAAYSSDSKFIATGANDDTLRLWNANNGNLIRTVKSVNGALLTSPLIPPRADETSYTAMSIAFSRDGKWIVSGHGDHTVKLWETDTGKLVQTLKGHSTAVTSVAFDLEGSRIVSGDANGCITVWDALTGGQLHSSCQANAKIIFAGFNVPGDRIYSFNDQQSLNVHNSKTGEIIKHESFTLAPSSFALPDSPVPVAAEMMDLNNLPAPTNGSYLQRTNIILGR